MRAVLWVVACAACAAMGCGGASTKASPASAGAAGAPASGGSGSKATTPPADMTGASGGSSGAPTTPLAGMTGGGASARPEIDPPSNVDVETCADAEGAGSECFFCCQEQGFPYMGDFEGKCVCSGPVEGNGDDACAAQAPNDACAACCDNAGFKSWRPAEEDAPESCLCFNHSNVSVCAQVSSDPEPREACAACCINAGYIASGLNISGFSALGFDGCVCLSG